ncbi:MAG: hypothetical protein AABZ53_15855 [Planctomycetota bacterium]
MSDQNTSMEPQGAFEEVYVDVPQWPKAIGIVSIIWAGIGLTCLGCGVIGMTVGQNLMTEEMRAQSPPMTFGLMQMIVMGLGGVNALLLLVAGIMTLRRMGVGRWLHLAYALASLPLFAVGMWYTLQQQDEQKQWYLEHPESPGAKMMSGSGGSLQLLLLVLQIVLSLGYPVFLLIWFGLVKRSTASMTGFADEGTEAR